MQQTLSTVIGKQLLSPAGDRLGYVIGATLTQSMKGISCLRCADGDDEEFYLPARAVRSYGDALIVGNTRIPAPTGVPSPVMTPAYTHTGELAGVVCDFALGENPQYILWKNGKQTAVPLALATGKETLIVFPDGETKKKASKARAAQKKPSVTPPKAPVKTPVTPPEKLPFSPTEKTDEPAESPKSYGAETSAQSAQSVQYSLNRLNLIGRKLKKSVYDGAGQPIAIAGERITPSVISAARRSNRLLELTVNTLTNVL